MNINAALLDEIFTGWKNYIWENPAVEVEAKRRMAVCVSNSCQKFTRRKICEGCGCFMPAKVRSLKSKCPIGKW